MLLLVAKPPPLHKPRMDPDLPFDRRLRRLRRDRSALHIAEADYLYRLMADELLDRLDLVKRRFERALELGCAGTSLGDELRARGMAVVAADAGFEFARRAGGVQCDEDRLPFADSSFDLIASVGVLDSVNDLPGALSLIRRALEPDGLFLGAFVGAGSLPLLREAMLAGDAAAGMPASPHLHPQIDVRAAGDLLARAGFALPVVDTHRLTVRFSGLPQLVGDLRAMAATNLLTRRSRVPLDRMAYAAAAADFASRAEADGRVSETVETIFLIGWGPAPSQPRPARRGSGSQSLAAALRPPRG